MVMKLKRHMHKSDKKWIQNSAGKSERKRPAGKHSRRRKNKIKLDLTDIG
jgi:hypothetical protein